MNNKREIDGGMKKFLSMSFKSSRVIPEEQPSKIENEIREIKNKIEETKEKINKIDEEANKIIEDAENKAKEIIKQAQIRKEKILNGEEQDEIALKIIKEGNDIATSILKKQELEQEYNMKDIEKLSYYYGSKKFIIQ